MINMDIKNIKDEKDFEKFFKELPQCKSVVEELKEVLKGAAPLIREVSVHLEYRGRSVITWKECEGRFIRNGLDKVLDQTIKNINPHLYITDVISKCKRISFKIQGFEFLVLDNLK